jgi:hypothetical protein
MVGNKIRSLWAQLTLLVVDDDGMSTVEYAIGTIGICRCAGTVSRV